jgi:hypothetical protein
LKVKRSAEISLVGSARRAATPLAELDAEKNGSSDAEHDTDDSPADNPR